MRPLHRALPFALLTLVLALVATPLLHCGSNNTTNTTVDMITGASDMTNAKLSAACMNLCNCAVQAQSAPDLATCMAGCTSMSSASYYPSSLFGGTMPSDTCLTCIGSASCADLNGGTACSGMCP